MRWTVPSAPSAVSPPPPWSVTGPIPRKRVGAGMVYVLCTLLLSQTESFPIAFARFDDRDEPLVNS